ncbi:hypothetical protein EV426DRAFT_618978 [Tirmania nivea]|nr:hypothetical protein EV426DRAFT_618978 [Tirmania nivea]
MIPLSNQKPLYPLNHISPEALDDSFKHPLLPSLLVSIYLPSLLAYGIYKGQLFCHHRWLGFIWFLLVCAVLVWIGALLEFRRDAWAAMGLPAVGMALIVACGRTEAADRRKLEAQQEGEGQIALEQE